MLVARPVAWGGQRRVAASPSVMGGRGHDGWKSFHFHQEGAIARIEERGEERGGRLDSAGAGDADDGLGTPACEKEARSDEGRLELCEEGEERDWTVFIGGTVLL